MSFRLLVLPFLISLALSGCASIEKQIDSVIFIVLDNTAGRVEDALRGYKVTFETIPAGAEVVCGETEMGTTPFSKWFDLSEEQKDVEVFNLEDCTADWVSGASSDFRIEISVDEHPRRSTIFVERPTDHPGSEADILHEKKYLAHREKVIQEAASAVVGAAVAVNDLVSAIRSSGSQNPSYQVSSRRFPTVSVDNARWNWVSSDPMTFDPIDGGFAKFVPLYSASSCSGAIVQGVCRGAIVPTALPAQCVGEYINGRCIGTVLMGGE